MDTRLELQPAEHAVPRYRGDDFLVAAGIAFGDAVDLDAPALRRGIAAVHTEQVAGEDGRFVTAGTSAHFEDGRGVDVLVLRRQQQGDPVFQLGQRIFQVAQFFLGQRRQLGVAHGRHLFQLGHLATRLDQALDRVGDRLDFGVFLRQLDDFNAVGGRAHARLDHAETVHDLVELGLGKNDQGVRLSV